MIVSVCKFRYPHKGPCSSCGVHVNVGINIRMPMKEPFAALTLCRQCGRELREALNNHATEAKEPEPTNAENQR